MAFEYINKRYKVNAEIGREILLKGKKKGFIAKDMGNYLGVVFDDEKNKTPRPVHPTCDIEYLETFRKVKQTASQKRYQKFLEADSGL